jgi:predicted esterase
MLKHLQFVLPLVMLASLGCPGVSQGQQPGSVTDSVQCRAQPQQSYALFLPVSYVPSQRWPVLYLFDPAAQGVVPVRLYQEAANAYGFILVGSNNSRNGPLENSLAAAEALSIDVESRFAVDARRVYTGGFSGGSRVATARAMLAHNVAGVVGCGAGLPTLPYKPQASFTGSYVGLIGLDDSNYTEMEGLKAFWQAEKVAHTILTFAGGHQWPPAASFQQGLAWLELQAMKTGLTEKRLSWVEVRYEEAMASARQAEATGAVYEAWKAQQQISADFTRLHDVAPAQQAAARLSLLAAVRQARDNEQAIRKRELALQQAAAQAYHAALGTRGQGTALDASWWRSQATELRKLQQSADRQEQQLATRELNFLRMLILSEGYVALSDKDYWAAITTFRLGTFLEPDKPAAHLQLAEAYALAGQSSRACKALEEALDKGLTDRDELEQNEAFAKLRSEKIYQKLLQRLPLSSAAGGKQAPH